MLRVLYIYRLWNAKFPKAVETHKEAGSKNYSHLINKNMEKKQESNDLCTGPQTQQPKPEI
jgi:hypothetical protein